MPVSCGAQEEEDGLLFVGSPVTSEARCVCCVCIYVCVGPKKREGGENMEGQEERGQCKRQSRANDARSRGCLDCYIQARACMHHAGPRAWTRITKETAVRTRVHEMRTWRRSNHEDTVGDNVPARHR